jgi:hypothetical protein
MDFPLLKTATQRQFATMVKSGNTLLRTAVDRDKLWATYLAAFPAGTNLKFRERTEFDCSCCRHFIKNIGSVVCIDGSKLVSLWDFKVDGGWQVIAHAMSALVKESAIENVFLTSEAAIGTDRNYEYVAGKTITWEHFYLTQPKNVVVAKHDIGTKLGETRSTYDVMFRSLSELTLESVDTSIELIDQGSLYRGDEHKHVLVKFREAKVAFDKLTSSDKRSLFCWSKAASMPPAVSRIRNTAIGTLLVDLSEGKEMDDAVKAFETKVAPANYKRPTALVTKAMIQKAREKVEEIGLTSALERRYATLDDISIRDVLFADRNTKKKLNADVFDEITPKATSTKKLDKIEEIGIESFIKDVLPKVSSLEVMVENTHLNRLVSLIAPCDLTAKKLFKWNNNFSWSYAGDFADSIKEKVKKAGGKVDGDLRCSLSWFNYDDLDLHMMEPGGNEIYFGSKTSPLSGSLDVDMNAGSGTTRSAVENICYADRRKMKPGIYTLSVHNYRKRESVDVGFEVEIEFDGVIHAFSHPNAIADSGVALVAEIHYSHEAGFSIGKSLPSSQVAKEAWGVKTQGFTPVEAVMLSPNFWAETGTGVGNKHFFFMLNNCANDGTARGFYNEFLTPELNEHRKVLEIVGSKMKTQESDIQLSGLGFSSTQRGHLVCKVKGSFTRTLKVVF